ncbi:histidine kinase [Baaleninema simplex]|uniref:histidine kinase n=1 Tax=Baaleninema simplex TaxID=2862350 RepID=UPI00034CFBCA|nr:histidine kinase [Baaleninema simplex]
MTRSVFPNFDDRPDAILQLLLFVDRRSSSWEELQSIRRYLDTVKEAGNFALEAIDVSEQPYLAEHFKLIATPTLIKLHPEPRQRLTGANIAAQLERFWPQWQRSVDEFFQRCQTLTDNSDSRDGSSIPTCLPSLATSAEIIQLSDEVFRLKQEKEELQEQLRFKDRLMSMLAHDLRNPLTSTSIAIETLEALNRPQNHSKRDANPGLFDQLLHHARTQTRQIEQMILDVLETSQSLDGHLAIHPQKVDLATLCRDMLERQRDRCNAQNLDLKTDLPQDLPFAYADPKRIRQVVTNLLDNAMKYTPAGGTISVSLLHRTAQKIQVSISDTGPGIPFDKQQQIFDDRVRLERDEKTDGYGLGLALCLRVVRSHYGKIWVDSSPGQGSTFHFTLPVYRD